MKENLGIIDIQIYFPRYYVSQYELEEYDKVPHGKYTLGLGQTNMSFVDDNEDINSMCLTVLDKLIKINKISLNDISRIEVGTETLLDKSKSIKTYLMDLFKNTHNNDIEGVTVINACYGGISALLNGFNWIFSKYYDEKYAIVICGDVACYAKGNARPTGGCGTIGVLLGKGGSLLLENIRASFMKNTYDFYKPNPVSEYPTVDGHYSLDCYLEALYNCLTNFIQKGGVINYVNDFFCFHCPYSKLVEKAFFQLKCFELFHFISKGITNIDNVSKTINKDIIEEIMEKSGKFWKITKIMQDKIKNIFLTEFKNKIEPGLYLCKQLGNLYTGSIFGFLLSLLLNSINNKNQSLVGSRIFLYSYGSGLASSMLVLDIDNEGYRKIIKNNSDIISRLKNRIKISPYLYESILLKKEKLYLKNNWIPSGDNSDLFSETYFLAKIDNLWRRFYNKKETTKINNTNNYEETKTNIQNNQHQKLNEKDIWKGFYKKNILERQIQIKKIYDDVDIEKLKTGGLNLLRADNLVENCIGVISLPIGLGLNFVINGQKYSVPMSTEEPSVIAAASSAAKLIAQNGGFFCSSDNPYMISQILYEFENNDIENKTYYLKNLSKIVKRNKKEILKYGNKNICSKMFIRGGGLIDVYVRNINEKSKFFAIEFIVNVLEAMGANLLNEVAEKMSIYLNTQKYIPQKPILKVLSNLSIYRKTTSEFKIKISTMNYKYIDGRDIANLIIKANDIAKNDVFRAVTHNKGIMNGIDAVAVALGQDFRAIESAVHAYASLNPKNNYSYGNYQPLTDYFIENINNEKYLYGKLTIPLAIGTVGGAINSNEVYKNNFKILGNPNNEVLCQIMVSVGLAQNFAALRALVSEGIQKGHINLHAKNIAYRAGTPDHLISDVVAFMKERESFNEDTAKRYLDSILLYSKIRKKNGDKIFSGTENNKKLSCFYIDLNFEFLKKPIKMNFLINSKIKPEINFGLLTTGATNHDNRVGRICNDLFGNKTIKDWLYEFMILVHELDLFKTKLEEIYQIKYKLKICVILFLTISSNLLKKNHDLLSNFINELIQEKYHNKANNFSELYKLIPDSSTVENVSLEFGMTVILELYEIYLFYLENYLENHKTLIKIIKQEVILSLKNFIKLSEFFTLNKKINNLKEFEEFFEIRLTRLNAIILLLIDLGFSEYRYNEEEINNLICLGRYAEIEITLYRDYSRKNSYSQKETFNSYLLFCKYLNENGVTDETIIKKTYFEIKNKEIENLIEKISKININGENGLTIKKKIDQRIKNYYVVQPNKNIINGKL